MSRARLALVPPPLLEAPPLPALAEIPFPVNAVVEITSGMSKGQRGIVLGPARSTYNGVADVRVQKENGDESWIRPDYLRRLS